MNIIFVTQGQGFEIYCHVLKYMKELVAIEKVGFYLTDSRFYKIISKDLPDVNRHILLKEWDIVKTSSSTKPDISKLRKFEEMIGEPYLWNVLVGDRRIYYGKNYAFAQDYTPRFNHERMQAILQVGIEKMEKFFDDVKPDCVVSFQCVTLGDHLSYLIAKSRNIQVLNLRPTRIKNYMFAGEDIFEPSSYLQKQYEEISRRGVDSALMQEAREYLKTVQNKHAMYEGVVPPSDKPPVTRRTQKDKFFYLRKISNFFALIGKEYGYQFGEEKFDTHISGYLKPIFYQKIVRPIKAKRLMSFMKKSYVKQDDLEEVNYAFFPLHTEPEVTLSVYSKNYINQIEAVRLISHNLPVGVKLIVKEHPWAIGKRNLGFYKKLLSIPNVLLADPRLKSRELIQNSSLITVIASSIGFEGLMLKKPVIVLGGSPFNFLPNHMIKHIDNPRKIAHEIKTLLDNYEYDKNALLNYICAAIKESAPVDYYTRLAKRVAYNPNDIEAGGEIRIRQEHFKVLAEYLLSRVNPQ